MQVLDHYLHLLLMKVNDSHYYFIGFSPQNMSERKMVKVRTQIESILSKWRDSHEDKKLEQRLFQSLDINSNLEVLLKIRPRSSHCAETLLNLYDLKKHLENKTSAIKITFEIIGIPEANRWTNALNYED